MKDSEKRKKRKLLRPWLRILNVVEHKNASIIPIVIAALETVAKGLERKRKELEIGE